MSEPMNTDRQLAEALDRAFAKLEKYCPEHKKSASIGFAETDCEL